MRFHTSWTKVNWTGQVASPQDGWLIWLRRPPLFDRLKPEKQAVLIQELDSAILEMGNRIVELQERNESVCETP